MNQSYFKKYNRENRVQTSEANFKSGMRFSRAPLDEDEARLLVNYDITSEGSALTVRDGIEVKKLYAPLDTGSTVVPRVLDSCKIIKKVRTEDNYNYYNAVNLKVLNQVENTSLYTAEKDFLVMEDDNEIGSMYALNISKQIDDINTRHSYAYIPSVTSINGFEINDRSLFARSVGCFAWDDNYYNFNDNAELIRSRYVKATGSTTRTFVSEKITVYEPTVKEAYTNGFNMLKADPYVFVDKIAAGTFKFDGVLAYNGTELVAEPIINKTYTFRAYYEAPGSGTYKIVFECRDTADVNWTKIASQENFSPTSSTLPELKFDYAIPSSSLILRISVYKKEGSTYKEDPEHQFTVSANAKEAGTAEGTSTLKKFALDKCGDMVYWKNYMWIYGLADAPRTLFRSDINNPSYFPYPNNIHVFEEQILKCVPFNENMLVFTTSQIYQISVSDGTFLKKIIQSNLNLNDFDAELIIPVKSMVFFKSGSYYYMVVPKTLSLTQEYALAPVSKNIEQLLDEFPKNVAEILDLVYNYTGTLELVNHYNFLNYENVHNIYSFITDYDRLVNIDILYNTVDRTWTIYTFESQHCIYPLRQDATDTSELFCISPINIMDTDTNTVMIQIFDVNNLSAVDHYYLDNIQFIKNEDNEWYIVNPENEIIFKNYSFIDTGYRNNDIDHNKRFRELQFKFNNIGNANLKFYMDFILNGETRHSMFNYSVEHVSDKTDPNYGLIYISRIPYESINIPGSTILGIDDSDLNAWELDNSRFPEITLWKARTRISGKGYAPRTRLLCRYEEKYEILGYTWVYRNMYSR